MAASTPKARYRIGADENGLGPRLGPMVVTAVLARVDEEGWRTAGRKPRGKLAERLGDSKQLVSHGDIALGEAWARALASRGVGRVPFEDGPNATADALVHAISLDDVETLRAPCPGHVEAQCWSATGGLEASPELVATIHADLDRLADKGVAIVGVRSIILCTRRMNDGLDAGKSRFSLDLHAMERLVVELGRSAGEEVYAVCGKVGGFGKYSDAFGGPLGGRLHAVIEEGRPRSAYHFPGVGEIAFVRDSDASDLCVAMSSLVGKWVRETLMGRIVRHYRETVPDLPDASGYYDPVTTTFIDATRLVRASRDVPDRCFERRGAEPPASVREKRRGAPA